MSNEKDLPKVLKDLNNLNLQKKIKIRCKKIKSGAYSLYLDIWHNGKRSYHFLKIYIKGDRKSLNTDKQKLKLAIAIRDQKEIELLQVDTGFELSNTKKKANFVEYFNSVIENSSKNYANLKNSYNHIRDYTNGKVMIKSIDKKFCSSFKDYLLKKVSRNSAKVYFSIFKRILNHLYEDEIINKNPANDISISAQETKREFLTLEELKKLKNTPCEDQGIRNAFLFSCHTGLRLSDIRSLTFDQINEGYLVYRQQKTNSPERVKLSKNALKIIKEQKSKRENNIFNLRIISTIENVLLKWVKKAGIDKHITFHCARHTFATLCLTYDIDIYTVSKLLGHKDIKTTQIYANLIDKKKDEAVDKLPEI